MPGEPVLCFRKKTPVSLVEVWQEGNQRWLSINSIEQSRIDIVNLDKLVSPVQQAYLASLLFTESPGKVLCCGLGGGAIARYLYHIDPELKGEAVEKDSLIADLSKRYFNFPGKNWSIIIDDIRQWQGFDYDLIIADIAENKLMPAWLTSEKMLLQYKQQLSLDGVLVINFLVSDAQAFSQKLAMVRNVFERRTLCLGVPKHKNVIVFAFNNQPQYSSMEQLASRVQDLSDLWRLDFNVLLLQLQKDNPVGSGVLR